MMNSLIKQNFRFNGNSSRQIDKYHIYNMSDKNKTISSDSTSMTEKYNVLLSFENHTEDIILANSNKMFGWSSTCWVPPNENQSISLSCTLESRKAPFKPDDEIVNEVAEKENSQSGYWSELVMSIPCVESGDIICHQADNSMEELKQQLADAAVKAAPPSKPPETPEEIAREQEIQRKIRESIVIVNPEQEMALLKADPSLDIEMSSDLRAILQALTTNYMCKLCSVRLIGPQMAAMHYNGKNHLKKLKNFVQTNGRSAGFNMESFLENEATTCNVEKKDETVESKIIDERKYCKICKMHFYYARQAEMHYKGKNHAKKLKNVASSNRADIYECKICCVTVTSHEHLKAHLNGIRHKQQIRKMDCNEICRGYTDLRGKGSYFYKTEQKDSNNSKRGSVRPNGQDVLKSCLNYTDEELMTYFGIEPTKKYKFDLANYRTPLGWLYCAYCNVSLLEESQFLMHLGSKMHSEHLLKKTKVQKSKSQSFGPLKSNPRKT